MHSKLATAPARHPAFDLPLWPRRPQWNATTYATKTYGQLPPASPGLTFEKTEFLQNLDSGIGLSSVFLVA
jgi:hypothetical protein